MSYEAKHAYESTNQCLAIIDWTRPPEWLANMFRITGVQSMLSIPAQCHVRRMNKIWFEHTVVGYRATVICE